MSAFDPKRTCGLFGCHPSRCICVGCDLTPNDVDVTAQIVQLVREGQWKTDVADGLLNTLDFGLLLTHMYRAGIERSLQSLELGVSIEQTPTRDPIVTQRQKAEQW